MKKDVIGGLLYLMAFCSVIAVFSFNTGLLGKYLDYQPSIAKYEGELLQEYEDMSHYIPVETDFTTERICVKLIKLNDSQDMKYELLLNGNVICDMAEVNQIEFEIRHGDLIEVWVESLNESQSAVTYAYIRCEGVSDKIAWPKLGDIFLLHLGTNEIGNVLSR